MKRFVPWLALPVVLVVAWRALDSASMFSGASSKADAASAASAAAPGDKRPPPTEWAHWRGPEQNGVSREVDLPLSWWRIPPTRTTT
jgi:hypothetical protein